MQTLICRIIGAAITIAALLPVFVYGILNPGVWLPAIFGVLVAAAPQILPRLNRKLQIGIFAVVALCIVTVAVLLCVMLFQATRPADKDAGTVIVLGCEVTGEEPSRMLRGRLDAAVTYLTENPNTVCIVTGGMGDAATITEAECMKRYLTQRGIAPERIYKEEASANTEQNIKNAKQIAEQNRLDLDAVIVTDAYHEYRALLYARRYGFTATPYASYAPFILQQSYWIRDMLGLIKYAIK